MQTNSLSLTIFTDGGSRGNPGEAALGVSVLDQDGTEVYANGLAIGVTTNNQAEYQAFLHSLTWLLGFLKNTSTPIASVTWKLDSMLVVEQLLKHWKIKHLPLLPLAQEAWSGLEHLSFPYKIVAVPRAQNKRADQLVNEALDALQR